MSAKQKTGRCERRSRAVRRWRSLILMLMTFVAIQWLGVFFWVPSPLEHEALDPAPGVRIAGPANMDCKRHGEPSLRLSRITAYGAELICH